MSDWTTDPRMIDDYIETDESPRLCDVCGEPVGLWPERHNYHRKGCPKWHIYDKDGKEVPSVGECDCDFVAHPACCPMCHPERPT